MEANELAKQKFRVFFITQVPRNHRPDEPRHATGRNACLGVSMGWGSALGLDQAADMLKQGISNKPLPLRQSAKGAQRRLEHRTLNVEGGGDKKPGGEEGDVAGLCGGWVNQRPVEARFAIRAWWWAIPAGCRDCTRGGWVTEWPHCKDGCSLRTGPEWHRRRGRRDPWWT